MGSWRVCNSGMASRIGVSLCDISTSLVELKAGVSCGVAFSEAKGMWEAAGCACVGLIGCSSVAAWMVPLGKLEVCSSGCAVGAGVCDCRSTLGRADDGSDAVPGLRIALGANFDDFFLNMVAKLSKGVEKSSTRRC